MMISDYELREIEQLDNFEYKVHRAALMYAEAGFYVIPVVPNGKAIPNKAAMVNYSHASKRTRTINGWYGEGGKFRGWNIGLACGRQGGLFTLDMDVKPGGINGLESLEEIKPDEWEHTGPIQRTPSGGVHYLYEWDNHARSTTGLLGPGIDTRGGNGETCSSHIVAWPSVVNGEEYKWERLGEVRKVPAWVIGRLGVPIKRKEGGRGNENVGEKDLETKFSIEEIQEMLEVIDPADLEYNEWFNVGCAIHSQHPGEEGLAVWDKWSSTDKKRYQPGTCAYKWEGLAPDGTIRVGTLIMYAKQRGYDLRKIAEARVDYDSKINAIVDAMNHIYAICPEGGDITVVEKRVVIPEMARIQSQFRFWKKSAFKTYFENQVVTALDANKKVRAMSYADIWLAHPTRTTYPSGYGLFPNKPERYHGYLNMWQGFTVQPSATGCWDRFKWHIENIMCEGDPALYNWVYDWMADLVQDPGNPKGTAVVMHGIEGCGKGTFCSMIGHLFGHHYKHVSDQQHMVGNFNGHLADCIFLFADEAIFAGDKKHAGKIKAYISEPTIMFERKGVDAVQFKNCIHVAIASNESWFIGTGANSRRFLVLDLKPDVANNREYFNLLRSEMENGGYERMLYDLLERKITGDLRFAPETGALQLQREQYAVMESHMEWWFGQLARGVLGIPSAFEGPGEETAWPEMVLKQDVLEAYEKWCRENTRRKITPNRLYAFVEEAGFSKYRPRLPNGDRPYAFMVSEHPVCSQIAKLKFGYAPQKEENDED